MPKLLSDTDLVLIRREADMAACRLVRQLRLQSHEREDLRQDLLVDLLSRLKSYDRSRGTLGAFAGTVLSHRAGRLAQRIRRERTVMAPVSLDDPLPGEDGATLGEATAEADGYQALSGQPTDRHAATERRLEMDRALGCLSGPDLELCAAMTDSSPTEVSARHGRAKATVYRQLREIRLSLMSAGVSAA